MIWTQISLLPNNHSNLQCNHPINNHFPPFCQKNFNPYLEYHQKTASAQPSQQTRLLPRNTSKSVLDFETSDQL